VPEIYKWEALRRFAYSPHAVSFHVTPHVVHTHHTHKAPVPVLVPGSAPVPMHDAEQVQPRQPPFEPFELDFADVDFDGPFVPEMKPYTEDINPDQKGIVRFKKRVPETGFELVRPITRPQARAMTNRLINPDQPQHEGRVIVYRKTLLKPIAHIGVYSE
jgi:hypothetical protein